MFDNILDGHDGIGALRDDPAGGDRHRLAGLETAGCRPPGRDPAADRQRAGRIAGTKREPVHRGARKRRQVDGRARVLGQHPACCGVQRNTLGRQHLHVREHRAQGLVDREQGRHRRRILGP